MKQHDIPPASILLVDDNKHGLTARRLILVDHGYDVETALSGEEAWEIFQKRQFDIVVTDLRMSGMDGLELIRRIRAANAPTRTILLSGFAACLGLTEQSAGADEVLTKSNREVAELLRAVRNLAVRPPRRGAGSQKSSGQGGANSKAMRAG